MRELAVYYAGFDHQVREVVAYGYEHASAFRERMQAAGLTPADLQTSADLVRLPILRKEDLIELQKRGPNLGGMLTVPLHSLRRLFQSPGPIFDPEPDQPDAWRWAPAFRAAGFEPTDIVINCFGYHLTPAGLMFEEGVRAIGGAVIPAGIGNQTQQIEAIVGLGVTAYVGLPSYLKALLDKARELGHDPQAWPLCKALVAAEPMPPSLRAMFEQEYGIIAYDVYGTAETGNIGYQGPSRQGWHLPHDALVQVCDLNSGEPVTAGVSGEVVVTLFRRDYPLIRFGVGDLSAVMSEPSPDPIGTPRLVGWLGRSGDSVKVRGLFVHPRHASEAVQKVGGVAGYQIVIERVNHRDELICRVCLTDPSQAEAVVPQVSQALQEALKLRCTVEIVAELPADAKPFDDQRTWE